MDNPNPIIKANSELRQEARERLKGNWGTAVLLYLIFTVVILICSGIAGLIPFIGAIAIIIIEGPLILGLISCFIKLIRNETFSFEGLFDGFKNFKPAFILIILVSIFTFLWSLLLWVPGIIAGYRYSMSYFILNDNPQMSGKEALEASKKMMNGFKGKLFLLHLSFIGWWFLSLLTFGIGLLWLAPYVITATAGFYENLKEASTDYFPDAA